MDIPEKKIAHIWQDFRIRCIELAISGGAQKADILPLADEIGTYILTKSEIEKSQEPKG